MHAHTCTHARACAHTHTCLLLSFQVTILLPDTGLALPLSSTRLLRLELWHGRMLLSHSSMLLLPSSLPDTAAELQFLPWGINDSCADVAAFMVDLGRWLHFHDPAASSDMQTTALPIAVAMAAHKTASSITAWNTGRGLLRQAVLWGMPCLATLLLECLLALPSRPSQPFAQLMHTAPSSLDSSSSSSNGGSTNTSTRMMKQARTMGHSALERLGSLLHLALLSPRPLAMLQVALGWGRRWGTSNSTGRDFSFRWQERNKQVRGLMQRSGCDLEAFLLLPHFGMQKGGLVECSRLLA